MSLYLDIELTGFIADDRLLRLLGWQHTNAIEEKAKGDTTILQVLWARFQRNPDKIEDEYTIVYDRVMDGIKEAGYDGKEAKSKITFVKTSMTAVRNFMKNGGDIMSIEPKDVSKSMLQNAVIKSPKIQASRNTLIANLKAMAAIDSSQALKEIKRALAALRKLKHDLEPRIVSHQLDRQQVAH